MVVALGGALRIVIICANVVHPPQDEEGTNGHYVE
jgi:hypothetical protein